MHCTTQMRPQDRAHGTEIKPRSVNFTVLTLSTFLNWYFQSFSTTEFLPLICDYTLIVQLFKLFQIVEEVHKGHNTFSPNSLLYHHIWLNSYTLPHPCSFDHGCVLRSWDVLELVSPSQARIRKELLRFVSLGVSSLVDPRWAFSVVSHVVFSSSFPLEWWSSYVQWLSLRLRMFQCYRLP